MNDQKLQTFEEFLASQDPQVSIISFVLGLIGAAILSFFLSRLYVKFGSSLSNRHSFSKNFILLSVTTMVIITIVKSSLALSLGLVGALSIVRFRTAIKEPEELAYLFIAIAIGLGMGAAQFVISISAFALISLIIWVKHFYDVSAENQNLFLSVLSEGEDKIEVKDIIQILEKYCDKVNLRRFDETSDSLEASFMVEFQDFEKLKASQEELRSKQQSLRISFIDNKAITL